MRPLPSPWQALKAFHILRMTKHLHQIMHSFSISLSNTARFLLCSEPRHIVARYRDHWPSMTRDRTFLSRTCIANPTSVRGHQQQASVEEYTEFGPNFASGSQCRGRILVRKQSRLAHSLRVTDTKSGGYARPPYTTQRGGKH